MMSIPDEAYCKADKYNLHIFYRIAEYPEGIKERCRECGKQMYYNKKDGKIDNKLYGRCHFRDILQPAGQMKGLFEEIYGRDGQKRVKEYLQSKERKKNMNVDIKGMVDEEKKSLKRQTYLM